MKVEKAWTFLFYNAGHEAQATMSTYSLGQLERVGSDQNTHVVALNHRKKPWFEAGRFDAYEGTRTYYVERQTKSLPLARRLLGQNAGTLASCALSGPHQLKSPVIEEHQADPGSAATLKKFLVENMRRYPSQRVALVLSGHGAAFQGQAIVRGPEGKSVISNDELARVLREVAAETGRGVDLVNLNTCYSANLETLYPLRDATQAVVASQDTVALGTQPFAAVLEGVQRDLAAGRPVEAADLARRFVDAAHEQPLGNLFTPTLTAFDTSGLGAVADSVAELQSALQAGVPADKTRQALERSLQIDFSEAVALTDLGSLAAQVDRAVQPAADKVRQALKKCILAEQHADAEGGSFTARAVHTAGFIAGPAKDYAQASGLTIFCHADDPRRLKCIEDGEYGRDHSPRQFLEYLRS